MPLPVQQEALQSDPLPQHKNENKKKSRAQRPRDYSDSDSDSDIEESEAPFRPRKGTLPIEIGRTVKVGRWTIETTKVPRSEYEENVPSKS